MQSIELPTSPASGGGSDTVALSANVLGRKVARTPCGHVFHTTCLEEVFFPFNFALLTKIVDEDEIGVSDLQIEFTPSLTCFTGGRLDTLAHRDC